MLPIDFKSSVFADDTPPYSSTVTMVLKRKRSDSEISTSSSLLSSPPSASNAMMIDSFQSPQYPIRTPSLFSSRTRKRHRDNRPSEADVHQHTLSLLYSAQQNQSQLHAPSPFQLQDPVSSLPSSNESSQQSNLHSFWGIPSARQSSPSSNSSASSDTSVATPNLFQASNCEDCDASLNGCGDGSMDVDMMMDIDMDGGNHACTSCGKQVCHSCAVSNLGAQRCCLNCAGKKKSLVGVRRLGW